MIDKERFERLNEIRKHNDEDFNLTKESVDFLLDEIDRLRVVQTPPQGKTVLVRVRVAVAVDNKGRWAARGSSQVTHEDSIGIAQGLVDVGEACFTLTATLPVPQEVEVVAEVSSD